jgi:hypothetical protein
VRLRVLQESLEAQGQENRLEMVPMVIPAVSIPYAVACAVL